LYQDNKSKKRVSLKILMNDSTDITGVALTALKVRIARVMPAQIRSCLDQLDDDQLWWRPNEQANSVGNLTLHVCGAVQHFLNRGVGGQEYVRDRPAEFATRSMEKAELVGIFEETIARTEQTFNDLEASRLIEPSTEPAYYSTIYEDLFGVAIHVAVHTGQIVYITKMLKEGSIDELWAQTHRTLGAWRS
jgi:uncharacterized damage-inducible protein DinB